MDASHSSIALTYDQADTIAAIATPPGEGGVAIIRISGKQALEIAAKVFSGPVFSYASHTAHFGTLSDLQGNFLDEILLLVMLEGRSYTGETTVEIHCHGGSLIARRILHTLFDAGARSALPGEFSFRSFMNGKMDLAKAEAVQLLISAKNEKALTAAENQLKGALSSFVSRFQAKWTEIAAILEAWVDFPEEGLEFASLEEMAEELQESVKEMEKMAATFQNGKIIHEGLSLCLVGAPNVGKSSLMNALLNKERAIVSSIPGTTRDILEDSLRLNGLHFKISDTAGIRETEEEIEQEGIRRSKEALSQADLILLVMDATLGIRKEEELLLSLVPPAKTIVVWNKIDLPHPPLPPLSFPFVTSLSAKEREGLELLHTMIDELIWKEGPPSKEEVVIANVRHKEALLDANFAIRRVIEGLNNGLSPEFLTLDMRMALQSLGKIIGVDVSEEILSAIFSKFCIGK